MPKKPPATLTDVAKRAGVSTATVSRLLNGDDAFREETVSRVQQAVKDLSYVTQRRHKSKAHAPGEKTSDKCLAAVCLYLPEEAGRTQLTEGTVDLLSRLGGPMGIDLRIHRCTLDENPLPKIRDLIGDAEGVFLRIPNYLKEPAWVTEWIGDVPTVQFLGYHRGAGLICDHVVPDSGCLGSMAAGYFTEKGVKRIIYAEQLKGTYVEKGYGQAFFETGREAGLETGLYVSGLESGGKALKKKYRHLTDACGSFSDFNRMIQAVHKESPTPFGVFLPSFTGIAMATSSLMAMGIQINKDAFTLGRVSNTSAIESLDPMPAVIHMNQKEVAARTLQQLLYRIEHPTGPFTRLQVAPELIRPEEMSRFLSRY